MSDDQQTSTATFISEQVALLGANDTAGLSLRYAEDAVIVRLDTVARGRDEIKQFFDNYIAQNPQLGEPDGVQVTDDVILYQIPERIGGTLKTAVGTLVFRDGLVWRQTAAFVPDRPDSAA